MLNGIGLNYSFISYKLGLNLTPAFLYLGLTAQTSDPIHYKHVIAMTEYAFRLKQQLANVNEHSFNNFQMRIGKKLIFRGNQSNLIEYNNTII